MMTDQYEPNYDFDNVRAQLDTQTGQWFKNHMSEYVHSVRGRIMSIQLSIRVLERKSGPENQAMLEALYDQVRDLQRLLERFQNTESDDQ